MSRAQRAPQGAALTAFELFISNVTPMVPLSALSWRLFYDFIVVSHQYPDDRPSVSWIADALRPILERPGHFAVAYAHGIYVLARRDGFHIFEGGVNP